MVQKADPGFDGGRSGAVKIERDSDIGFLGDAVDGCLAHVSCLLDLSRPCNRGHGTSPLWIADSCQDLRPTLPRTTCGATSEIAQHAADPAPDAISDMARDDNLNGT